MSAGVVHIVNPDLFLPAMPPYIPWHLPIVYGTGILEILLAIGLFIKSSRFFSSLLTALYFIAILPAHIHVSLNSIPMFGVSNSYFLWGRTLFQVVLIYWAWLLRKI